VVGDRDESSASGDASIIYVDHFNAKHPLVNPLVGSRLQMVEPRSIRARPTGNSALTVKELAWTGPNSVIRDSAGGGLRSGGVPLIVAVEKDNTRGAVDRGLTRIVVAGDSFFLGNALMKFENSNEEFARLAVNWLLDQTPMMAGVGPRRMVEYRVNLTHAQMTSIRWSFLGAMPGGILLLGGLVWLRRRR
jgi:hypothetical protein